MKRRTIKVVLIMNMLFDCMFAIESKAQSPVPTPSPIQVPTYSRNVYFNNPNSISITIAYSFDKIHWTKTSISGNSKKTISMQTDTECYVRVYTDKSYELFQVEKREKYRFTKNDDDKWEIEKISDE
jgi:hypothetical protein